MNISRFSLSVSSTLKKQHCYADLSAIRIAVCLGGQGGCPSGHQHRLPVLWSLLFARTLLQLPPARRLGRCGPEPASLFCSSLPSSTHSDVMGSLKSVVVGVFIPQRLANATHQGFFYFFIFLSESQFISTPLDSQIQMVYWVTGGKGDGSGGAVGIRREEHKCP